VEAERDGREMRYRLTDPDIITACVLMRGALQRRLARLAGLSQSGIDQANAAVPIATGGTSQRFR
jgi:hypothetical protein